MRSGDGGQVAAALLLDALFGEPPEAVHPTVLMGRSISAGFGGQAIPQFCESWWEVRYQIRWANDDFNEGSLLAYADLWNDNCYFIQAP